MFAGTAKQQLFSAIPSRPIYLSIYVMFVRRFSPLQSAEQPSDAWRGESEIAYSETAGAVQWR